MLVWCCAKANKLWAYQVRHSATENPLCGLWVRIASCSQPQSWHRETQVCFFMSVEIGSGRELLAEPFLFCLNKRIFCYRTHSGPTPKQRWWMFLSRILQGQVTVHCPSTTMNPLLRGVSQWCHFCRGQTCLARSHSYLCQPFKAIQETMCVVDLYHIFEFEYIAFFFWILTSWCFSKQFIN